MNMQSAIEWSELIRNIALVAASIVGAVVAWKGLSTWKLERRSDRHHNLAESILILLYERRDAIADLRNPFAQYDPIFADPSGQAVHEREYAEFLGYADFYEKKFKKLQEIRTQTYPKRLISKAIWGDALSNILEQLFAHEQKLVVAIQSHLRARNPQNSDAIRAAAGRREYEDTLWSDPESDDFQEKFDKIYSEAEAYLRVKLEFAQ